MIRKVLSFMQFKCSTWPDRAGEVAVVRLRMSGVIKLAKEMSLQSFLQLFVNVFYEVEKISMGVSANVTPIDAGDIFCTIAKDQNEYFARDICSLALQLTQCLSDFSKRHLPLKQESQVSLGIAIGPAILSKKITEIGVYGEPVQQATDALRIAEKGGSKILVTKTVADLASDRFAFCKLGEHEVPDVLSDNFFELIGAKATER